MQLGTNKPSESVVGNSVQLPLYVLLNPCACTKDVDIVVIKWKKVAVT